MIDDAAISSQGGPPQKGGVQRSTFVKFKGEYSLSSLYLVPTSTKFCDTYNLVTHTSTCIRTLTLLSLVLYTV